MSDYAQRLAVHPRWRWEPGILACDPVGGGSEFVTVETLVPNAERHAHRIPDIHHPATRGWLLAWLDRDAVAWQVITGGVWCEWVDAQSERRHNHYTGDDALAAALLAVWGAS